jgi:hypothetical protein
MAKRVFQDPELGKFTWSSDLDAWEGRFKLDKDTDVGLNIGGDHSKDDWTLKHDDLLKAMPKVKQFLALVKKNSAKWAQQGYQEIESEIDEYVEMNGFAPSDAEVIEGDPTLHEIDVEVGPKLAVSGSVRYSLQVLLGGAQTLDYWVTVTLDSRGRYKEATLDQG